MKLAEHGSLPEPAGIVPGHALGRPFADYELLEEIARGGMGVVYRARQLSLGREVAVKMILAGELAGEESLRMFRREAHAAANLHHPNIVPVYEIGEHELQHYFTMRLVPGGRTIAEWAGTQRGSWRAIASAAAKAARAVEHAHSRGVLHRDLKPSNILWDEEAGPQVTDFGLAKLLDDAGTVTRTLQAMGSPSYMAPEQMGGRTKEITTATDVYGLGAVLYELISGQPPFLGSTALETMKRAAEELPPPLSGAPRDLCTICLKCLAKATEDRYASAAALADDLERFSRGEPVAAVPLTWGQTAWRWAQRQPQIAALVSLIAISLVAGIVGVTWQWRKAEGARRGESAALARATSTVVDLYTHSGLVSARDGDTTRAALWFAKAAEAALDPSQRAEHLGRQIAWRNESATAVRVFESQLGNILRLYWNASQTALLGLTWNLRGAIWDVASESRWEPAPGFEINNAVWANQALTG
ncbi:MAG: serine/threonine-protein kinase [Verrucomicrobiota bacterium]